MKYVHLPAIFFVFNTFFLGTLLAVQAQDSVFSEGQRLWQSHHTRATQTNEAAISRVCINLIVIEWATGFISPIPSIELFISRVQADNQAYEFFRPRLISAIQSEISRLRHLALWPGYSDAPTFDLLDRRQLDLRLFRCIDSNFVRAIRHEVPLSAGGAS